MVGLFQFVTRQIVGSLRLRSCRPVGQNSRPFDILTAMFTPQIHLKRAVVALSALSLLWVFAACILICGLESAAHSRPGFVSTFEVTGTTNATECEGCPDASLLKATSPERTTFKHDLQVVSNVPSSIFSAVASPDVFTPALLHGRQSQTDPPLALLPTLRI